jgi:membrane protein implicated in regulation of membrane protease activity
MNLHAIIWLVLAVFLAALEAGTTQFVSIWFSLGAVAAMLLALAGAPDWLQIIVFVAVSVALVAAMRPLSRRLARPRTPTNADRAIGAEVVVLRDIGGGGGPGQVKVNGLVWNAAARESPDGGVIRAGERVRIIAIEGAKLIVEKVSEKDKFVLEVH